MGINNTTMIHSNESTNLFNEKLISFNEKTSSILKVTTNDGDETDSCTSMSVAESNSSRERSESWNSVSDNDCPSPLTPTPQEKPKAKKSLRFSKDVNVLLIPTRKELARVASNLWWTYQDCESFKREAYGEIRAYIQQHQCSVSDCMFELYQIDEDEDSFMMENQQQEEEEVMDQQHHHHLASSSSTTSTDVLYSIFDNHLTTPILLPSPNQIMIPITSFQIVSPRPPQQHQTK